ncbi:IQ and HECT domain protein [Aspergillus avenaceus]|uniref:HECT-type E3 ubiquitin transferase n=1 Tax=Aspergillus avenaceus TaxID=36643 RepID=A0A5N6TNA8_ASPAV|nr:IQ and HECT domain protein [Aspergillus avenaceus]
MFQSFTGNSRRPRQVNLGARNTNPFAAFPPSRQHPTGPQNTLAIAQQERALRQQERDRLGACRILQRTWRGYRSRKITRGVWRAEWDAAEQRRSGISPHSAMLPDSVGQLPVRYGTAEECLSQLRLLVQFLEPSNNTDIARITYFSNAFQKTLQEVPTIATEREWTTPLKRLARLTLRVLRSAATSTAPAPALWPLLELLMFLVDLIPKQMALLANEYFSVMAVLTNNIDGLFTTCRLTRENLVQSILALLRPITAETLTAYEWFARTYLTIPDLPLYLGTLDGLANNINYKLLTSALGPMQSQLKNHLKKEDDVDSRLWLLSYLIYFHKYALGSQASHKAPESGFVKVVSELLNSTALYISRRLESGDVTDIDDSPGRTPLHPFVKEQLFSLINQGSITGLLSELQSSRLSQSDLANSQSDASREAKVLATYALTLLRVFPRRGDDIRMWLYLGSATSDGSSESRIPAIKYFWQASRSSKIFATISQDSTKVLSLLKPANDLHTSRTPTISHTERDEEWTIILLFLELYTFVLKVMDDEEFFSSGSSFTASSNMRVSWTKESALPLPDIKDMTVFLKNLAFTLYWNSADLNEDEPIHDSGGIRSYFGSSALPPESISSVKDFEMKNKEKGLSGVTGIPLDYFKGLVTGLLRMIHERDSRRKFLPDGHWLMTSRFDMEGFIPAVVAEEENRHQLQDEDEEGEQDDLMDDAFYEPSLGLIGTGRAQQTRRIEALRRRQQQAARRKQLEAVAPRLELLRNMPFFIPFPTRVQIFREFIYRDQMRRRQGFIDPDAWRMSVAQASMGRVIEGRPAVHDILARHHANIRRERIFKDAFDQFYELGEGLKEPIQITFIDKFDTPEAGIDGGGVTKEFLTSVTNEAFKSTSDLNLFEENDQHLLYPNPAAVEYRRELLRQAEFTESSADWNENIRDLLRRYEFLGRVIGKCLYEGILVDVNFAPFFLLKWALTGGTGSAQKETAYRANLNDLKDLDQGLYQGLLQLKNYTGDVEDFSLNFTVTDTVPLPDGGNRTITRDLKPNGSDLPVTNQNRLVYISYIARYRLQVQPALQTNAFLQGLGQIIQPSWLSMFNQSELQTLVSGDSGDIDVSDLRRNTLYGGVYTIGDDGEEHPTIKLFWDVMHRMKNEERQKVLRFVTSTPRAPLLGFSHLNPRFSIRDSSEDQERLPSTSTCVNLLKLPRYTNAEVLREKLLYAINSGAGFDLS